MISILLLCVLMTAVCHADDWTSFNGPTHDNLSAETGLLSEWKDGQPKLLWKTSGIGNTEFPGYASVVIAGGTIYTAGNVQDNGVVSSVVYALDEKTGKIRWTYDNGSGWNTKSLFPGERSTPTIDGKLLYALSSVGQLTCLDISNPNNAVKKWSRNIREDYAAQLPEWAYAESPLVDGDKVVVWVGGTKAAAAAVNKDTGQTIWETPPTGEKGNYATMTIFDYKGKRFYVNMTQKGVLGIDSATGKKLFYHKHETQYDINANAPAYLGDGKLLVNSGNAKGCELLQISEDGTSVSVVWEQQKFDVLHGGIIVKDGYVYGAASRNRELLMCVDIKDGKIVWESRKLGAQGATSYADGFLYCMNEKDGTVVLVKATPEKYTEAGRMQLPEEGSGSFWAHPVICGQKLYLRHAQFLYCYSLCDDETVAGKEHR